MSPTALTLNNAILILFLVINLVALVVTRLHHGVSLFIVFEAIKIYLLTSFPTVTRLLPRLCNKLLFGTSCSSFTGFVKLNNLER
jgi:hypothetical protein